MVELYFGSKTVRDYLDHERTGTPDPERLEEWLDASSDVVRGILLPAFSLSQLQSIIGQDKAVRMYCCQIAIGIAASMKPGLINAEGKNPHIALQDRAEKKLREIVEVKRRAGAEEIHGNNRKLGTSVNRDPIPSIFQATNADRIGPGGF